ncbi:transcription termination factor MTERF4, chloroplastic-like [Triticum dicoccoides]|uniref:transcription termination factor MTERF4, chloroplastic-like n=1 Tax=Triticum dicoccoides TaxID=85692 RepID=UPI0018906256|nr:transcription termination factor MTERF4, chloroplastic-like [Triticum dicoccoides]
MVPVPDYLGKIGVRRGELPHLLRRYPQVLHASIVVDLAPVVEYLQGMDFKPGDVPRVLEGTMSTSVAYLVGIGVARRQIGGVIWVAISGREGGRRRPLEPNQQRSGRTTARGHRRSIRFFPHDPTPPAGSAHGMGASSRGRPPAPPHEPGT